MGISRGETRRGLGFKKAKCKVQISHIRHLTFEIHLQNSLSVFSNISSNRLAYFSKRSLRQSFLRWAILLKIII
jgi:hypothetical protein